MQLGAFSISLPVKDLGVSRTFYEKLGFAVTGGDAEQGWLILKNDQAIIGLFHGMFEKPMLTFNPGWGQDADMLDSFTDVRDLQTALKASSIVLDTEADANSSGPASITLSDPDGNPILIDQHR